MSGGGNGGGGGIAENGWPFLLNGMSFVKRGWF